LFPRRPARGAINHILKARIYRGEIHHKGQVYPGAHEAIIDADTWQAVQSKLLATSPTPPGSPKAKSTHLLTGLLFDDAGNRMSPAHAKKGQRRYYYYCASPLLRDRVGQVGAIGRAPAHFVDDAVVAAVSTRLRSGWRADHTPRERVRAALTQVTLKLSGIVALVRAEAVTDADHDDEPVAIIASGPLRRRGNAIVIDRTETQPAKLSASLVRAVALARRWADDLAAGKVASTRAIARDHGLCHLYVGKLLPLAFLAPDLVQNILEGRQPRGLSIANLLATPLPLSWSEQRARFRDGV
jgi:Recombinase.